MPITQAKEIAPVDIAALGLCVFQIDNAYMKRKKLLGCLFCTALVIGCGDKNSATNLAPQKSISKPQLPAFAAQCSYGNGGQFYRLVSDPGAGILYFGSIANELNINAARASGPVEILEDRYEFILHDIDDDNESRSILYRKDGELVIENPIQYQKYSGKQHLYTCTSMPEDAYQTTLQLLKTGNATGRQAKLQKQQEYNDKPNKF